jgi:hypothetical protein
MEFSFQKNKDNENVVSLKENTLIAQAANGDFRVLVENNKGGGYELVFSTGRLYMRNRYSPFHERKRFIDIHTKWREKAYGAWNAVYRIYRGQLTFSFIREVSYFGRKAQQFSIGFSRVPGCLPDIADITLKAPKKDTKYIYPIEPTPSVLNKWREKADPTKARGTMIVDIKSAVILKLAFQGSLTWREKNGDHITLFINVRIQYDDFAIPVVIAKPRAKEIKPIPERVRITTHPLEPYFSKGGLGSNPEN